MGVIERPKSRIVGAGSSMEGLVKVTNDEFIECYIKNPEKEGKLYKLGKDGSLYPEKQLAFSSEWIEKRTGVKTRYFLEPGWNIHDLNYRSIDTALGTSPVEKKDIAGIINAGVSSPGNYFTYPSHAEMVQLYAGLQDVLWTFDVVVHQDSEDTALNIARALNSQQEGIYIGIFAETIREVIVPGFNSNIYGRPTGIRVYVNGKSAVKSFACTERCEDFVRREYDSLSKVVLNLVERYDSGAVKGIFVINDINPNSPLIKTNSYHIMRLFGLEHLPICCDVAAACASTQMAFVIGDGQFPRENSNERIIVTVGESLERRTDLFRRKYPDMNNVLFGTASAGFILEQSDDNRGFVYFDGISDPFEGRDKWIFKDSVGYVRMPYGKKVMRDAILKVSSLIIDAVKELDWNYDDMIEHHTHNANSRIHKGIGEKLANVGIRGEIPNNIEFIGNASAGASAKMTADRFKETGGLNGFRITHSAYGGGTVAYFFAHQF